MGTRHLTAVVLNGIYRIAQYGQWDGYPEGQGKTVLAFLKTWDRPKFEAALLASSWMTEQDDKEMDERIKLEGLEQTWHRTWPHLSRDMGAGILQYVQDHGGTKLRSSLDFAGDSLFCEFAYVLDLDKDVLEVYRGFNHEPLKEGDRFFTLHIPDPTLKTEYYPVRLVKSYPLTALPTWEQMADDVCPKEKEVA